MKNQKKINLLFVSMAFPPKVDPECLQTAKYFKYLVKNNDLNIDVVTSPEKTLFMSVDENMRSYAEGYRQLIEVPFFENRYVNFLMRKFDKDSLNYPDSKFRFAKKSNYVIDKLEHKPDIIYSRSFPISSAIMAYNLQKEFNVPWVLHLSDPWMLNPDNDYVKSKSWNEEMEKKCFEAASILSFTSEKTIELYKKKYPKLSSKMRYFPNVYDIDDKPNINFKFSKKIKVVFTGGLVGARTANPFLEAIKYMENHYANILNDFEFIFAGAMDRENQLSFTKAITSVKHIGLLSYKEALNLQMTADILLLIDLSFDNEDDALFFPSKLLDYMLMQKHILALTDKNSTSWNFIHHNIGDCFVHNDTKGIVDKLIDIWQKWQEKDEQYFIHNKIDEDYSAHYNADKLSELFHISIKQK